MSPDPDSEPGRAKFGCEIRPARRPGECAQAPEVISSRLSRTTLEVVAFLHHGAQGVLGDRATKVRLAEKVEGAHPVDGLGDPGRLGQVELAQPVDGGYHLASQRLGHAGRPYQHDLHLAFGGRVADPVVQAAPLQRVVQLAGAVRGEHDERRALGPDRADLRDR